MAIKWRPIGAVDISVAGDTVMLTQTIEVYDTVTAAVLRTLSVSGTRDFARVVAAPTQQIRQLLDGSWLAQVKAACIEAKRNQQADAMQAAAATYITTLMSAQEGV
jgi:hypothetical protein